MGKCKIIMILSIAAVIFIFAGHSAKAVEFDPNFILSNAELLDADTMSLMEIERFLQTRGSYLADHHFRNCDGHYKSGARIIYEAAHNYDCEGVNVGSNPTYEEKAEVCERVTINPKLLLVLLQKEQSLIEDPSPEQGQLDWATGYGCPDGGGCNSRWKGFGKQVNSAALQFYDYMQNPDHYNYQPGKTYTVSNTGRDPSVIRPENRATAALYNYTPHVYYGNYNFYKLWLKYFTRAYPNGSLLQAKGEPGVWLIDDGKKRPFETRGALTTRFDPNKVITVDSSVLAQYPKGDPLKFPQYSLIRSPRGTIYLLVDDKRRGFASGEAFRKIGYNPEEIIDASWDDIKAYQEGRPITATSTYPTGALLQNKKTGGIYWVSEGKKAPLLHPIFLNTKFRYKSVHPMSADKLAEYEKVEPVKFDDGEIMTPTDSPAVYVIEDGKKRAITSAQIFEDLNYKWENVITVPPAVADLYEEGEPISQVYLQKDQIIDISSSTAETATATTETEDQT